MSKGYWFVQVKDGDAVCDADDEEEEFDDEEIDHEVAVIHSSDKHGQRSWGWASPKKIILDSGEKGPVSKQMMLAAETLAELFNSQDERAGRKGKKKSGSLHTKRAS